MAFSCNGSVTKWIYGAIDHGTPNQPVLQIWRQLGPNNYIEIGSSLVNNDTMIGTILYEFIPQISLEFQEGDIFGVYAGHFNNDGLVLYEQRESGPINLRISTSVTSPPSTITEMLITVNNDFPLVSVEISMHFIIFNSTENSSADISTHSFVTTFTSGVMEKNQIAVITSISVSHSLFSTHSLYLTFSFRVLCPLLNLLFLLTLHLSL